MDKINIGQIGIGKFGKKILDKLQTLDFINIKWVCNSKDKWWKKEKVDWVIIATPTEFHYEQTKYFLLKKTNVFCEKPCTLSYESFKELIEISKTNKVYLYIDNILMFKNLNLSKKFIYKKWGGNSLNIIDRIAYHHFYILYSLVSDKIMNSIEILINKNDKLSFNIFYKNIRNTVEKYFFQYDLKWYNKEIHNIIIEDKKDALETMLSSVFSKNINFEINLERNIFATKLSELLKTKIYGKCAVVGAGIYGITAALKLRSIGFHVDLFEKKNDILGETSGANQYRIHKGYHYPRSEETIISCKKNEEYFIKYYKKSIIDKDIKNYYSISSQDSLTTAEKYLETLDKLNLSWKLTNPQPNCDLTIEVEEKFYDIEKLKDVCHDRIIGNGVNLYLNNYVRKDLPGYNYKIFATYSTLNNLVEKKTTIPI